MTAQCEGMGEVGSARYEPALLPPCPSIRVLSYSNCQEIHSRQQTGLAVYVLIVHTHLPFYVVKVVLCNEPEVKPQENERRCENKERKPYQVHL